MTAPDVAALEPKHDIFFPIVSVYDDGRIEIDFADSYDHSVDEHGKDVFLDDYAPGATLLDTLIPTGDNGLSLPAALRRMADYIEAHDRTNEGGTPTS